MAEVKMIDYALKYARMGLRIHPCNTETKKPYLKAWQKKATTDEETIKKWWAKWPDAQIALATGEWKDGYNIIAIDCDNHPKTGDYGTEDLRLWEDTQGEIPETWGSITGSGGEHYIFRTRGKGIRSRTRCYGSIDIRGEGGYIILPPSLHPNGNRYEWQFDPDEYELAEANSSVLDLCGYKESNNKKIKSSFKMPDIVAEGSRNDTLHKYASSMQARGYSDQVIKERIQALNKTACNPPLQDSEVMQIFESVTSRYPKGTACLASNNPLDISALDDFQAWTLKRVETLGVYHNPDFAVPSYRNGGHGQLAGKIYSKVFGNNLRYCTTSKCWWFYSKGVWQPDEGNVRAMRCAKALADALCIYSDRVCDPERDKGFISFAQGLNRLKAREDMVKDAISDTYFSEIDLDADKELLCTKNGVLDLRTLELLPHSPDFLMSKQANVAYNPNASAEVVEKFLDDITQGADGSLRPALKEYLLQVFGYICFGDKSLEEFYILYGSSTRNGKTTALETVSYMLGDYSKAVNPELFSRSDFSRSSGASPEIASLKGARLVTCGEVPRRMPLDEAMLKRMTGHTKISARGLYKNNIEFVPEFSIVIDTNFLPRISDTTIFDSDRVKVIPFDRHFTVEERDPQLKNRLRSNENLSALLNLLIAGYKAMKNAGNRLVEPAEVIEATNTYMGESDKIGEFMKDCLIPNAWGKVSLNDVYFRFQGWCNEVGLSVDSKTNLKAELKNRNVKFLNNGGQVKYNGVNTRNVITGYSLAEPDGPAFED